LAEELIIFEAILTSVTHIATLIGFRGKPKNPPSYISEMTRENFWLSIKQLIKHKNYILVWLSFGFIIGSFHGIVNVLSFIV